MIKKTILTILFILPLTIAKAQTILDQYVDFNNKIVLNQKSEALALGEQILASTEKLPAKTQTNFYAKMASLYDNTNQFAKAILYYEKVLAAEPNYYVAHLALAYLYLQQSNDLAGKLNNSRDNQALFSRYYTAYKKITLKCLQHFEKAQACDPDDNTLANIKHLYFEINDLAELKTLDARLNLLNKQCVSVLTDE